MNPQPLVSVIMTVYNGQDYLQAAIDSILRQTLANFEFVIVDDGSTDETPKILALAAADDRVQVISVTRVGRAKALNIAWHHTSGRYVANIDADDQAAPDRLASQATFLDKHPAVGLLGTACHYVYEGYDKKKQETLSHPPLQPPATDEALRTALIRKNPFVHSSVMMRRAILAQVGGYDEACPISIDYDLWVRIAKVAQLACLPEALTIRLLRRESYFHRRVSLWARYQQQVRIRWLAWRTLQRPWPELRYVFVAPTMRSLYGWSRQLWGRRGLL
ncbi:MAG: glycosyltransferase family 2 protein [Chloroflexota bacterium]